MRKISQLICVFVPFLFWSCNGLKQSVTGFWSIEKIEYENKDLLYDIKGNTINFKSNTCILPYINNGDEEGTWEVTKQDEKYLLKIKTENEIFSGTHEICFKKDFEKKLIKMIIFSNNLSVECSKWQVNFDRENKSIDEYLCN